VTDARSAKIADLDHQPWAELCWYFRDARGQFRLVAPPATAPDTFAALRLEVHEVDHLELRPSPHRRHRYRRREAGWRREPINP